MMPILRKAKIDTTTQLKILKANVIWRLVKSNVITIQGNQSCNVIVSVME